MEASGLWEFSTHTHDFHHLDGNTARLLTKNEEEVKADEKAGYPPECNPGYEEKNGKCVKVESKAQEASENHKKVSHFEEKNVNDNKDSTIMKIQNINDITDESMKQLSASAVSDFISEEIKKVSDEFNAEKEQREEVINTTQEKFDRVSEGLESVKAELDQMKQERAEQEALELFNQRMTEFDNDYELTDEIRAHVASDIKDMETEAYASYKKKMAALMGPYNKKKLEADKKAETEEAVKAAEVEVEAAKSTGVQVSGPTNKEESHEEVVEEVAEVVEDAVDNAEEVEEAVTNTTEASEGTLFEKYKDAFSIDQFNIKL